MSITLQNPTALYKFNINNIKKSYHFSSSLEWKCGFVQLLFIETRPIHRFYDMIPESYSSLLPKMWK